MRSTGSVRDQLESLPGRPAVNFVNLIPNSPNSPFSLPEEASGRNVVEIVFVLPVFVLKCLHSHHPINLIGMADRSTSSNSWCPVPMMSLAMYLSPEILGNLGPFVWPCSCSSFDIGPSQSNSSDKSQHYSSFGVQLPLSFKFPFGIPWSICVQPSRLFVSVDGDVSLAKYKCQPWGCCFKSLIM